MLLPPFDKNYRLLFPSLLSLFFDVAAGGNVTYLSHVGEIKLNYHSLNLCKYFRGFFIGKLRIFIKIFFGKLKTLLQLGFPLPIWPAKYHERSELQIGIGIFL